MKRLVAGFASILLLASVVAVPRLLADVKTSQKVTFKLAGVLGMIVNRMAGGADGITSNIALKGTRKLRANESTGEIIDLGEQKVYTLDMKKKEYTVKTFDELRAEFQKERADAAKSAANEKPDAKTAPAAPDQNAKQMQYDFDVKKTGQHKTMLGRETTEIVVTVTGHEQGKKIEDSGGFIMTNDMWMAPKVASLDDILKFDLKYFQAIYGEDLTLDMKQAAQVMAAAPAFASFAKRMQAESEKNPELQGTALANTMTFDRVKSADEMKDDQSQKSSGGGGGLGGMLGKKLLGGRGDQSNGPRGNVLTTTNEYLSIEPAVTDADVALPAGFKLKK
jgi:hypothetical protein